MSQPAIKLSNIGKRFRIGDPADHKLTFRESIMRSIHAPFKKVAQWVGASSPTPAAEEFWALKDINFEIQRGEAVGIIGRNGAGKSTLLKILSKITEPTEGRIEMRGRVGSLLEVGTGFHPELTGRENIFLNGAILGMRRTEIIRKFDEIVAFAEIEKFLDTPVKHYSSGMYMRLAFAVAAHLETDILMVDEVLAVGDAQFQKKCLGKMGDVAKHGRTVIFVSHNMSALTSICSRSILLKNGRLAMDATPEIVVNRYLMEGHTTAGEIVFPESGFGDNDLGLKISALRIKTQAGDISSIQTTQNAIVIEIDYTLRKLFSNIRVGFVISTILGQIIFESYDSDFNGNNYPRSEGRYRSNGIVPPNFLNEGKYFVSINAGQPGVQNLAWLENVISFSVEALGAIGEHHWPREGVVRPLLTWTINKLETHS